MKILNKVLWAIDFNSDHEILIPKINRVINEFRNEIVILHVLPSYIKAAISHKKMIKSVEYELKNKIAIRLKDTVGQKVKVRVEVGNIADKINHVAEEEKVNFVLLNKGITNVLGSNGFKILRNVKKPVIVLTHSPIFSKKHIVCAVNNTEECALALKSALHHARKIEAKLSVISVYQPLVLKSSRILRSGVDLKSERKLHYQRYKYNLDRFLNDFDFSNVITEKVILEGNPESEIIEYSKKASVLYQGNGSKRTHQRLLMGSVSESVIRKAQCVVVVVKRESVFKVSIPQGKVNPETHLKRGNELVKLGFIMEAIAEYKNALKDHKWPMPIISALSRAYKKLGNTEEAQIYLQWHQSYINKLMNRKIECEVRHQYTNSF